MSRPLIVLLVALVVAPPAGAAIVPQQSIGGVRIGMTVTQVRDKLGAPDAVAFRQDEILGRARSYRYGLTIVRFDGDTRAARVVLVSTRSRAERVRGAGVGSTVAQVRRAVSGETCQTPSGGPAYCSIGQFRPGRRITDFTFGRDGRVRVVSVGIVID